MAQKILLYPILVEKRKLKLYNITSFSLEKKKKKKSLKENLNKV